MARTRMPVLLDRADIKSWLTGAPAMELLKPETEDSCGRYPAA